MMQMLRGKHALVTGGGGGIGTAIAVALAALGAKVTLVGRDREKLERAASSAKGARCVPADIANADSVRSAFAAACLELGPIHMLINAAGAAASGRFERTSTESWERTLAVNLSGVFFCCREVVGPMIEAGYGRIVNVASTAGLTGYRYVAAYCAAKHGVVGLTRALALETAHKGITVNAVCPGYTETTMLEASVSNIVATTGRSTEAARAALLSGTPRGAFVTPEEVANAAVWLCSPGSEAVTGQAIAIDGGELAG
jgi:NAD(P)-dependent dehydrogenase (short-subunit alcohol dehydrogenase family)